MIKSKGLSRTRPAMAQIYVVFFAFCFLTPPGLNAQKHANRIAVRITTGATTDKEKVDRISKWIAKHIKYDVKRYLMASSKRFSSKKVLRRKKALCDEYAQLFKEMCDAVEVKAYVVDGYTKDLFYDVNDPFYRVDHAWNAVKIDNRWFLLDVTFMSGGLTFKPKYVRNFLRRIIRRPPLTHKIKFKRFYDNTYYLNTPEKFMFDHFPDDPLWQLGATTPIEHIEADSNYYHKRDNPDIQNLFEETGKVCNECYAVASLTRYQEKLYKGVVTPNYNNKQEEFAIEAHKARGDSLLRVIKEHVKVKIYTEEDADSCKKVVTHYKEALYDLKCHGKNIRNEYKYKIDKERKKLNDCKKNKEQIRRIFIKERAAMVNWREYSKERYKRLKRNRVEDKFKLNLPNTIPEMRPHPRMEKANDSYKLQKNLVEKLKRQCERELEALRQLKRSIQSADSMGLLIVVNESKLCSLRQRYYDDLKKVLVDEQNSTNQKINTQTRYYEEISNNVNIYKKAVKSADSLRSALKNLLKYNYTLAANIDHVTTKQFDSLTSLVKNDYEYCLDLMSSTDLIAAQLLTDTKEGTVNLIQKMKKETSYLNREVGIERSRAKVTIKHYVKDRNSRFRINTRVQKNLYYRIAEGRRLNKQIELELRQQRQRN